MHKACWTGRQERALWEELCCDAAFLGNAAQVCTQEGYSAKDLTDSVLRGQEKNSTPRTLLPALFSTAHYYQPATRFVTLVLVNIILLVECRKLIKGSPAGSQSESH